MGWGDGCWIGSSSGRLTVCPLASSHLSLPSLTHRRHVCLPGQTAKVSACSTRDRLLHNVPVVLRPFNYEISYLLQRSPISIGEKWQNAETACVQEKGARAAVKSSSARTPGSSGCHKSPALLLGDSARSSPCGLGSALQRGPPCPLFSMATPEVCHLWGPRSFLLV